MGKPLVIVESPAKARTIGRFLGEDFHVEACIGHIRDLPQNASEVPASHAGKSWAQTAVDVDNGFQPLYVLTTRGKEQVRLLRSLLKEAPALYLATDEDREGEAIAWHLVETLNPKVPIHRLAFHEITEKAIRTALESPRELDMDLIQAQETRRIVDRLFGYNVSPLLWRKVRPKLSAGRVQSVAVRLVVERERERMAFCSADWWDLQATFGSGAGGYSGDLVSVDGQTIAKGRDFDSTTGQLSAKSKARPLSLEETQALRDALQGQTGQVASLERKSFTEKPRPPFTTSTLQQEANRKFKWPAQRTMRAAQRLYENGWITYMRTDSTFLSSEAITAARGLIEAEYGSKFLPSQARAYRSKSKGAQEAHEAIRPAGAQFKSIGECRSTMGGEETRLYELIWMRTVACQMTDASGYRATLDTRVDTAIFRSKGKVYTFPGYRRAYVEGADNPEEKLKEKETELPSLSEGSEVETLEVELREHATQPPSRLTEASLIKEMEARGIGRPSTYASIIGTIQNRGYVFKKSGALVPTWTAIAVIRLLEAHFGKLIDYDFTAKLENGLDAIARGESDSLAYLTNFYRGSAEKGAEHKGLMQLLADAIDQADPRKICSIPIGEVDGVPLLARVGRYGPYLEHSDQRGRLPDDMPPDELNVEKALEILHAEAEGPLVLGSDPESGQEVTLRTGRFGPYVQLGELPEGKKTPKPKRASLLKGMSEDSIDLETACLLLSLPRTLGEGADGKPVMAHNGRYGPYLKCGDETRNIPAEHSVLTINLEQAQELLAQPSTRGRSKPSVIREIVGEDAAIKMMNGRWGPYVTDGKTNASLPKGTDPESVDYDAAFALLEKKRSSPRKGRKRKS